MAVPLIERAGLDHVENVFLFVADSVRADATAADVTGLGVSGRAIAPSLYTASSFPSIVSGRYPTSHRIWSFDDRLRTRPALIDGPEGFGLAAETIWTHLSPAEKPPFRLLRASAEDAAGLDSLESPFVAIEHHKGGHLPYGYSFDECESVDDFFERDRPTLAELPALYEQGVRDAESTFQRRVEQLRKRGLLEETLVIYTSDHGEVLGAATEGMAIGHGYPMVPALVHVPVVFAGAGLPDAELSTVISGTDVGPTAIGSLGRIPPRTCDGRDLWSRAAPPSPRCRSEVWWRTTVPVLGEVDKYRATSVWTESGGHVFQNASRAARLALTANTEFHSSPWSYLNRDPTSPRRLLGFLRSYLPATRTFGEPEITKQDARDEIEPFEREAGARGDQIDSEHLRALGYLE